MYEIKIGKVYRNRKNKQLYVVEFIGNYTEEPMVMELMVGYKALYRSEVQHFVRPYSLFLDKFDRVIR